MLLLACKQILLLSLQQVVNQVRRSFLYIKDADVKSWGGLGGTHTENTSLRCFFQGVGNTAFKILQRSSP